MSTITRRSSPNQSARGATVAGQPWIDRAAAAWSDVVWLFGRILIGGIFVQSGFQKLMGLDAFAAGLARNGIPGAIAQVLAPVGAAVEFVGGLAIVFGLMTRYAAGLRAPPAGGPIRQECGDHRWLSLRFRHRRGAREPRPLVAPCRVDALLA